MQQNNANSHQQRERVLTPGGLVFRRFRRNRLAIVGLIVLVCMFAFSFLGGLFSPYGQSQVFQQDEIIMKDYATCASINEPRYTLAEGAAFSEASRAAAALAIAKGEGNFQDGDQSYTLLHPAPCTPHPSSIIHHPAPCTPHPSSRIHHPALCIINPQKAVSNPSTH